MTVTTNRSCSQCVQVNIARRYLEPQAREDAGVPAKATSVTDAAMLELITEYAR